MFFSLALIFFPNLPWSEAETLLAFLMFGGWFVLGFFCFVGFVLFCFVLRKELYSGLCTGVEALECLSEELRLQSRTEGS